MTFDGLVRVSSLKAVVVVVVVVVLVVKAALPNYTVCLIEHSRNTATESKPHQGSSTVVEVIQSKLEFKQWNSPHCTYILNKVSGNGLVVTINRPFGYNYDIQPFHPCSVLQGGVMEKKHDRKTETVAETWAFRSTGARR